MIALSFQAFICLVMGVVFLSVSINCTNGVIVTDDVIVSDPSATSSKGFIQVEDYTVIADHPATRKKRNVKLGSENHWTGGIVPYNISSGFSESEKLLILQSMKHWEDHTCIRFRPTTNNDMYSIMFIQGNGDCHSYIGRIQKSMQPQEITLTSGSCFFFHVVVHEIGHSLGFYHEHTRQDRNNYVHVIRSNILRGFEKAFDRISANKATTHNFVYDYASIMHYSSTDLARPGTSTLIANDANIPIGDARELSPLDVMKTNQIYNCSAHPVPPPSIIVPDVTVTTLVPNGISCGRVIKATGPGSFTSPQYPRHIFNTECAFVLQATEGYGLEIRFPQFNLDPTTGCTEDYVQVYSGASVSSSNLKLTGKHEGRLCDREESRYFYSFFESIVTIYYRTNGRNFRSDVTGLNVTYNLVDIDECKNNHRCHFCKNVPGSFVCNCRDGYYLSHAARTCFDVNECAFGNGGCANICTNFGGSYRCSCNNGLFLQADGLSCGRIPPSTIPQPPTPGTIPPPSSTPATTTLPPVTTSVPSVCGGELTNSLGTFSTPNWPSTYSFNFNCTWNIVLNNPNAIIEISFDNDFGLGGKMPACPKDQLILFDGESIRSQRLGLFCHLTRPDPINSTSNRLTVMFVSTTFHGPTRHGFRAQYRSIIVVPPTTSPPPAITSAPTTSPPSATTSSPTTTPPPATTSAQILQLPQCGGGFHKLTSQSGSLQTFNWPNSPYPINTECDWDIECPVGTTIIVQFEDSFRVAGSMPECTKDQLLISGCDGVNYGPYCHMRHPETFTTTCNVIHVSFYAGSQRGQTRTGFKLNYICTAPTFTTSSPQTPTLTPQIPTLSPQCGGGFRKLTSQSGSLQTFNWPNSPYPINTECDWDIECPVGTTIIIQFEDSFRVAGSMPECTKDQLLISGCDGVNYGPYCHMTHPETFTTTCNTIHVSFYAGSQRGKTRTGFKLNYICTAPTFTTLSPQIPTFAPQIPTLSPKCGGGVKSLTAPSGSIQTLNWPENPYPINTECVWDINCSFGIVINFEPSFRLAGKMPHCIKDQLEISGCGTNYGRYCHLTPPEQRTINCNKVNVLFRSAAQRGISRTGFKLNYRCF